MIKFELRIILKQQADGSFQHAGEGVCKAHKHHPATEAEIEMVGELSQAIMEGIAAKLGPPERFEEVHDAYSGEPLLHPERFVQSEDEDAA